MTKRVGFLILAVAVTAALQAQNVGDQKTAGYDNQRTGLNAQMGNFNTPLTLTRQADLQGVVNAQSLTAFDSRIVVGEPSGGANPVRYSIFNLADPGGTLPPLGVTTFPGTAGGLDFTPAFAGDVLLLGGPATSTVKAIQATSGVLLWQDASVGGTAGRDPVITDNLALYAGMAKLVAAEADSGIVLWEFATTTASAPIAMQGNRAYLIDALGTLNALNVRDGSLLWSLPQVGADGSSLIAVEEFVFTAHPGLGLVGAIRTLDQTVAWTAAAPGVSPTTGIALAYDRLFLFCSDDDGSARVSALDPETGDLLWTASEEGTGAEHAFVANNSVYYYNSETGRIRVRDAFSGVLLFSLLKPDLRSMVASEGQLLVLLPSSIEIYGPSQVLFFAQTADGEGQATLIEVINLEDDEASATVDFFNFSGDPMVLPVLGEGDVSSLVVVIPARSSRRIQTGSADDLQVGWSRVTSNRLLRGTAVFQFSDAEVVLFEAGVAQSNPTGEAAIFVFREPRTGPAGPTFASTALAAANPFSEDSNLTLTLLDSAGLEVAQDQIVLGAGEQFARFIEELFPDDVGDNFEGTLLIQSDNPIVVTSLRTQAGFQLSSLPAGQVR